MKTTVLVIFCLVLSMCSVGAQVSHPDSDEWTGLIHLTEYLSLSPEDFSFRPDYLEPDSFRLARVSQLMSQPLGMIGYASELKNAHVSGQPEILARILMDELAGDNPRDRVGAYRASASELQARYNLFYVDVSLNQLLGRAANYLDVIIPRSSEVALARVSKQERVFLINQFKELLVMRTEEEHYSPESLDSLEKAEEQYADRFAEFGTKVDVRPILDAGIDCLRDLLLESGAIRTELLAGKISASELLRGSAVLPDDVSRESYLGKQDGWAIGGTGNDYYNGDYNFILDLGGDDVYDLSYDPADPHPVVIIDLSGDDLYRAQSDYAIGSGCFSSGILIDYSGNDRYDAASFGLGSGYFGFGVLFDGAGDDFYNGDTHVQGAASVGLGLLVDEGGRDIYNAAVYSQGFGFVGGLGMIYESGGADSYYAGGKYKDFLRYSDHFLSMSQGFGIGVRPILSGGVGAIIDLKGNDNYYSDIFAQAASYWWSLGLIYDSSGNDNYQSFQYAQGAATHMTLGALIDDTGNDVYFGKGLVQGCGHDYSCGLILDRGGNDTYTAYDLSQGAGSANGIGLLIDNRGDDRYSVKNPANTQGYGNPRREFGSIGLFIDLGGEDQYDGNGKDNYFWRTDSKWGGGMDIELHVIDSAKEEK